MTKLSQRCVCGHVFGFHQILVKPSDENADPKIIADINENNTRCKKVRGGVLVCDCKEFKPVKEQNK